MSLTLQAISRNLCLTDIFIGGAYEDIDGDNVASIGFGDNTGRDPCFLDSGAPMQRGTPVTTTTWGSIKALYRD